MSYQRTDVFNNKIAVLVLFSGIALVIFSSSTGRLFLSDDYCTIENVAKGNIILPSFFRPAGDLTLKWNFDTTGADPFYFYVTNILLHALNSFLVYVFCMKWFKEQPRQLWLSMVAGLLFLTYPSHGEAIFWVIGRGVSLAVSFSLLAMIMMLSKIKPVVKYITVSVCYFIALACYESTILLPIILFILASREESRRTGIWTALLLLTLFMHLGIRYYVNGGLWQAYEGEIFSKDALEYVSNFLKIIARLFIPPFDRPALFLITSIAVFIALCVFLYVSRRKVDRDMMFVKTLVLIVGGLMSTVVIATTFGVSTRNQEGDRLLYFPSVFYCLFVSLLIVRLISRIKVVVAVISAVLLFQLAFLLENQRNWVTASGSAQKILGTLAADKHGQLTIINLPSDYKGAYIFRNCFNEALDHFGLNPKSVTVLNVVRSNELYQREMVIEPQRKGNFIFIWPSTTLETRNGDIVAINGKAAHIPMSSVLYWNKTELVRLK
jgi:hypothetical protein